MTTSKPLTRRELRVWQALETFTEGVLARVNHDVAEATGLSAADYRILSHLAELGDGQLRQRELALALGWDKSRISHQLTRMQERNLLARSKTPQNGSRVTITALGRAALAGARPIFSGAVRRHLIQRLKPDQTAALLGIVADPSSSCDR